MKNYRVPRTLAEGHWQVGYTDRPARRVTSSLADVLFATLIGIAGAVLLVHWWAS